MSRTRIGIFSIGVRMPGAPQASLHLVCNGAAVTGAGQVVQVASPPLRIDTYLAGKLQEILWGADAQTIVTLTGHAFHMPMLPNPCNLDCTIALDSKDAARNTASLRYLDAGGNWKELRDQPVKVAWLPLPE